MFVIPAIDIKDGACVRLLRGDFGKPTVYSDDPLFMARTFVREGAGLINVIDLDGAAGQRPANEQLILRMARALDVPVQVGGGIRSYEAAAAYLNGGVARIMLGTAAIENPSLVARLIEEFGRDRIIVAADIKAGRFAIDGWRKRSGESVAASIDLLRQLRVEYVLVTDIDKDGTLAGANFALMQQFIDAGFRVLAAGGIATIEDVRELAKRGAFAAVLGKALYENKLDVPAAAEAAKYSNKLAKRIIPCLDVKDGQVVKGTNFRELRVVGDPVTLAALYAQAGADELVLLDIAATVERRKTFVELVARVAAVLDIPFAVGGGVRSLDDIRALLLAGADKVSIGSAAVTEPDFVKRAVRYFGSQCIVISVDAKRHGNRWLVSIKGGTEATAVDAVAFSQRMARAGAGELLVNSLDRDGTNAGFDIPLLKAITDAVNIPVIASSGGGQPAAFRDVFRQTSVDAALGASIFHYQATSPKTLKKYLAKNNIEVRL